jgi:hypothetical protein
VAVLWGLTHEGINRWSLLIFGGGAAALWAWSLMAPRLGHTTDRPAFMALYTLPFAVMALLAALALWVTIVPQLT